MSKDKSENTNNKGRKNSKFFPSDTGVQDDIDEIGHAKDSLSREDNVVPKQSEKEVTKMIRGSKEDPEITENE